MGAYCLLGLIPSHPVSVGEIMEVRWFDYHGAIIFGDREEIACIPHAGCRLEVVATPRSCHRQVNLLLPGQVIRYTYSFFLGDRFELPGGTKVSLRYLVGFKLQLASRVGLPPLEDVVVGRQPVEHARTSRRSPCGCRANTERFLDLRRHRAQSSRRSWRVLGRAAGSWKAHPMTRLEVGDRVEPHPGTGRLGTVLDVMESRPRWLLVDWHTPPEHLHQLENEEFLTLAVEDARSDAAARAVPGSAGHED